ncbi:MAG: FKBP-type peptidyl-prolyl cis-trans isomerase [Paludibacteraceae bacterium]|nr:FKBP-type peptidyl-prolyl cis-trans isomerase [Paludibacteraceae bacterium]
MKKRFFGVLAFASMLALSSCNNKNASQLKDMKTIEDSVSYALGIVQGPGINNFVKNQGESFEKVFNIEAYLSGVKNVLDAEDPEKAELTPDEAVEILQAYFQDLKETEKNKNTEEGVKFLEENKKNDGVVETESGLQYKVINASTDPAARKPTATDEVSVHYEGRLINGKVFDSSFARGEQARFPLNRVIPGWTEGIQLMKEGDEFEFYIPSNLAYGDQGMPGAIPPASTLIFKVQLHKVITEADKQKEMSGKK